MHLCIFGLFANLAKLGTSWAKLEPSWGQVGAKLGLNWAKFGPSWGQVGAKLGKFGLSWAMLGILGLSLGIWGLCWRQVGPT